MHRRPEPSSRWAGRSSSLPDRSNNAASIPEITAAPSPVPAQYWQQVRIRPISPATSKVSPSNASALIRIGRT